MPLSTKPALTPTQQQAVALLAEGLSPADVASRLGVAPKHVRLWQLFNPTFQKLLQPRPTSSEPAPGPELQRETEPTPDPGPHPSPLPTGSAVAPQLEPTVTTRMASFS